MFQCLLEDTCIKYMYQVSRFACLNTYLSIKRLDTCIPYGEIPVGFFPPLSAPAATVPDHSDMNHGVENKGQGECVRGWVKKGNNKGATYEISKN